MEMLQHSSLPFVTFSELRAWCLSLEVFSIGLDHLLSDNRLPSSNCDADRARRSVLFRTVMPLNVL